MEPTRPPAPPGRGPAPARLTTAEETVAPINAAYPPLLANVHGKGAPRRFLEAIRERTHRTDDHTFTDGELDAFMRSLDVHLYPAAFKDDPGMRRIWHHFWEARTASVVAVLRRFIDETFAKSGRRIDPTADVAELIAIDRAVTRALLRADRQRLRVFVGRRGVELVELAYALWTSHADGWYTLATSPVVLAALAAIAGGTSYEDGVERSRPNSSFGGDRRRSRPPTPAGGSMKPYQAFAPNTGVKKTSK